MVHECFQSLKLNKKNNYITFLSSLITLKLFFCPYLFFSPYPPFFLPSFRAQICQFYPPPWVPAGNTRDGAGMGREFSPADNGDQEFKYQFVKRDKGGDHNSHTCRYPIKIYQITLIYIDTHTHIIQAQNPNSSL